MKSLSKNQLELAKSADRRLGNPADNYQNILDRTRNAFRDLKDVAEILSDIEKNTSKYTSAGLILDQF